MTEQTTRAGCYCRISSDPDDKREGTDRQRQDTAVLCEVKGWVVAGYYVDDNRSASNGRDRPEWKRLLADIEAGKIDAIAAWDQDRNWRMMHELEELRRFFASLKRPIKLATTGQGEIDLNSPTGVLMAQVKTAVSEHEIAMSSRRMTRAALQKAERGVARWNEAFGYIRLPDGTVEIDPATGPLVVKAYETFLTTRSMTDVARMLNDSGVLSGRSVRPKGPDGRADRTAKPVWTGNPWVGSSAHRLLRSCRYVAHVRYTGALGDDADTDDYRRLLGKDGQPVRGDWPPLVSEELWTRVQKILDDPARRFPEAVYPGRKYPLTGLMRCSVCSKTMKGFTDRDRGRTMYRCDKRGHITITGEYVEPFVFGHVSKLLARPEALELLLADDHDAELAEQVRVRRAVLTARLGELSDERADGLIDGPGYKRMVDRINGQVRALDASVQDTTRTEVLDGLPLGTPQIEDALRALSMDRYRAIVALLMEITILPVRRKGQFGVTFDPSRIQVTPRG